MQRPTMKMKINSVKPFTTWRNKNSTTLINFMKRALFHGQRELTNSLIIPAMKDQPPVLLFQPENGIKLDLFQLKLPQMFQLVQRDIMSKHTITALLFLNIIAVKVMTPNISTTAIFQINTKNHNITTEPSLNINTDITKRLQQLHFCNV